VKPPEMLKVPLEIFGKPRAFDSSRSQMAQMLSSTLGLDSLRLLRTQEERGRSWLQGSYLKVIIFF
jgi:hypothetical protein